MPTSYLECSAPENGDVREHDSEVMEMIPATAVSSNNSTDAVVVSKEDILEKQRKCSVIK